MLLFSCKKEDDIEIIEENDIPYSVQIDGDLWIPSEGAFCSIYNNQININAKDSFVNGLWRSLGFSMKHPQMGTNKISSIAYAEFNGHSGFFLTRGNGVVEIATFDTINGYIEANFSMEIATADEPMELINGVLKLNITSLFCPVVYDTITSINNLFNKWTVIGFKESTSTEFDSPPCGYTPYLKFENYNNDSILLYECLATINHSGGAYELINDSILFDYPATTMAGGPTHAMDYEDRVHLFLRNNKVKYAINNNNFLVLTNNDNIELHLLLN